MQNLKQNTVHETDRHQSSKCAMTFSAAATNQAGLFDAICFANSFTHLQVVVLATRNLIKIKKAREGETGQVFTMFRKGVKHIS